VSSRLDVSTHTAPVAVRAPAVDRVEQLVLQFDKFRPWIKGIWVVSTAAPPSRRRHDRRPGSLDLTV
jgi:hypothetical protein